MKEIILLYQLYNFECVVYIFASKFKYQIYISSNLHKQRNFRVWQEN